MESYADDYDKLFERKREGLLVEVNPIGLISGSQIPSRIASINYLFLSGFSMQIDPIVGYGQIKGFGSSVALHMGKSKYENGFRYGPRVAIVNLDAVEKTDNIYDEPEDVGTTFEIYFDFLSYYAFAGSWRWHWGVSLGNGISDFGKRSDIGPFIKTGSTYRLEIGIGQVIR